MEARAKFREILFIGNSAISSKKLRGKILLAPNEAWDDLAIQEAREDILKMYSKKGYSSVDVTYSIDSAEDGFSRITFSIDEGERAILDAIGFEGNTRLHRQGARRADEGQGVEAATTFRQEGEDR